jgi:hypothetical protein
MSPLNKWYYLFIFYLTLRSKVKVQRRSLWYATHRLMVMHPHTKYHWPISKDKKIMAIKNGESRDKARNIWQKTQNEDKTNNKKPTKHWPCVKSLFYTIWSHKKMTERRETYCFSQIFSSASASSQQSTALDT